MRAKNRFQHDPELIPGVVVGSSSVLVGEDDPLSTQSIVARRILVVAIESWTIHESALIALILLCC